MKIAIHNRKKSFSERWVEYCNENNIRYELVNCYENKIIDRLRGFNALLWHWDQNEAKATLFARQLIASLQNMAIEVFPDSNTCWHFDDKVGQKYLLESINAPLVQTSVFYDEQEAMDWISKAVFPKVFKLRGGAGSTNVKLVKDRDEARRLCKVAFGRGFKAQPGYFSDFSNRIRKTRRKHDYFGKIKRIPSSLRNIAYISSFKGREKGYIYFQDFMPDNFDDTRITIIGKRAFAFRRKVRKNDFKASGSGQIDYDFSKVDIECVKIAFEVAHKLGTQSMAFDFVKDHSFSPKIVEVSYCYVPEAVGNCPGHWDNDLNWHEGEMMPQDAILKDVLAKLKIRPNNV